MIDNLQEYVCCTEKLYFIFATGCVTPQGCCHANAIWSDSRFVMSQSKNITLLIVTDIKVNRNCVVVFQNIYFNGGQGTPLTHRWNDIKGYTVTDYCDSASTTRNLDTKVIVLPWMQWVPQGSLMGPCVHQVIFLHIFFCIVQGFVL